MDVCAAAHFPLVRVLEWCFRVLFYCAAAPIPLVQVLGCCLGVLFGGVVLWCRVKGQGVGFSGRMRLSSVEYLVLVHCLALVLCSDVSGAVPVHSCRFSSVCGFRV